MLERARSRNLHAEQAEQTISGRVALRKWGILAISDFSFSSPIAVPQRHTTCRAFRASTDTHATKSNNIRIAGDSSARVWRLEHLLTHSTPDRAPAPKPNHQTYQTYLTKHHAPQVGRALSAYTYSYAVLRVTVANSPVFGRHRCVYSPPELLLTEWWSEWAYPRNRECARRFFDPATSSLADHDQATSRNRGSRREVPSADP